MKHPITFCLFFLLCFANACGDGDATSAEAASSGLAEQLPGTWETVTLEVAYRSYMGGDTAYQEIIQEADWGKVYGVKPPSTVFSPDGKLRRTYRLRSGEIANVTNGIWKVTGDSLFIIEPNITYTYAYDLSGDRLELSGRIDQDQDGAPDDDFRAVYRLTSRTR